MNIRNDNEILPQFSVLMSVYKDDRPDFLAEALDSVSFKQDLKPDQVVIVADGVLPIESLNVINKFIKLFDGETKFIQLENNVGLAEALNIGLSHCRNDLVARMDADDISLPRRFEEQIVFFRDNPSVSVCGAFINEVEPESLEIVSCRKVPVMHEDIIRFARKRSPISHPSVMFRKKQIIDNGGYPPFRKSQDYALWSLLLTRNVIFANLPVILLHMRAGEGMHKRRGVSHLKYEVQVLNFQREIKFINRIQYVENIIGRFVLRLSPTFLRKILYKLAR